MKRKNSGLTIFEMMIAIVVIAIVSTARQRSKVNGESAAAF